MTLDPVSMVWQAVAGLPPALLLGIAGLFVLYLGFAAVERVGLRGARRFEAGRISGIVGNMRGGKGLLLMWWLVRHSRLPGVELADGTVVAPRVAGNFACDLPGFIVVRSWSDVAMLPPGTLLGIDEAHVWCGARAGQRPPEEVTWVLSMLGKWGIELAWVSQHESKVASALRTETGTYVVVRKLNQKRSPRSHLAKAYLAEDFRKPSGQRAWQFRYGPTPEIVALYNTFELVPPASESESAMAVARMIRARGSGAGSTGVVPAVESESADPATAGAPLTVPRWSRGDVKRTA